MSRPLRGLPFLYNDDSFFIYPVEVGTRMLRITAIHRYPNNQNSSCVEESFWDLDEGTRHVILQHVQKKYPGKTVIV